MALPGRVEGRKSVDGLAYEIRSVDIDRRTGEPVPGGKLLRSIPLHEAMADVKLARTIKQNGWESI
ncbi:hypothetical protein [Sphingobium chungbukense]|uniref:Uncharacterized protein n=1 Tax=Sphingobium chungbukense TaxID=56193 RepID=A0A0M3AS07_9SPHN|nr:hypothetical protein [Sphingobium chungbukense]KKW92683.1 hypothetical protein YP76_07045 [Sphingobium chungbukense]